MRKSDDCYKLDHPEIYLIEYSTHNTTVWAITWDDDDNNNERVEIGCSWRDAMKYKFQYNCNNYPNTFGEIYGVMISSKIPCE